MINKKTYKRLTKKDKYGHWYTDTKINDRFMWSTDGKVWERDLTHCAFDGKAIDRLAELEDKIESGDLISTSDVGDNEIEFFVKHNADVRKETVREILNAVDNESNGQTISITNYLRKKYDVEVEE